MNPLLAKLRNCSISGLMYALLENSEYIYILAACRIYNFIINGYGFFYIKLKHS